MTKSESNHKITKLVRGRAATYDHSPIEISEPRFIFTDAEARDDLYALPARANTGDEANSPATGGRGWSGPRLLPMEGSPKNKPKKATMPLLAAAEQLRSQHQSELGIGMALGSPSQSPWKQDLMPPPKDTSIFLAAPNSFSSVPYSPVTTPEPREDPNRKGKWKALGGLFSKKTGSSQGTPQESFSTQPDREPQRIQSVQSAHPDRQPPQHESKHRRQVSRSLELSRPQQGVSPLPGATTARPHLMQAPATFRPNTRPTEFSPRPPPKDNPTPSPRPDPRWKELPVLEVNLPDTKMERYSVMFNHVLNPRHSTLLMRRQAQLERLRVRDAPIIIEEAPEDEGKPLTPPVRRATLPSPAKSPSYSLFPNTQRGPSPNPSTPATGSLSRPVTAPSPSPLNPAFSKRPDEAKPAVTPQVVIEEDSSPVPDSPETPRESNWSDSKLSPGHPRTASLGENDVNPRQHSSSGIVIHISDDIPESKCSQIPEPRRGTIELAGTPVYKTPVIAPIPKRPAHSNALSALNKPLPTPSPSHDEVPAPAGTQLPREDSRRPPLTQAVSEYTSATQSSRPPRKDSFQVPPPRPIRSQSHEWQPQDLSERRMQAQKARESKQRQPSYPPRDLQVPTQSLQPHSPLTDFHVRSPRKASLPVAPSQPLEPRKHRKASLAIQPARPAQENQLSPPKAFPLLHPPKVLVQTDVPPATPPKSSPPVPAKDPRAKEKDWAAKEATPKHSSPNDVSLAEPPVRSSAALQPQKAKPILQSDHIALQIVQPTPQRLQFKPSILREPAPEAAWTKPASAITAWPDPEKTAAAATATRSEKRPSLSAAEPQPATSKAERPVSLQRKPVPSGTDRQSSGPLHERHPSASSVERRPAAVVQRRPSMSAMEQQLTGYMSVRRPSAALGDGRPALGRAVTDLPHPLKSSPATAAEISIARQISISRRQQMMVPIVPKTARQPKQATLVTQAEPAGSKARHVPRKSQHALVETA